MTGRVQCPTTGFTGKLVKAAPQGINPAILILEAQMTPPPGMAGVVVMPVDLRFEEAGAAAFKQVTIRGAGADFTIPVKPA